MFKRMTGRSAAVFSLSIAAFGAYSQAGVLFSDNFSGSSIPNPPYTTTISNGGTISENGQLNVALSGNDPEAEYLSASDHISNQNLSGYNGTFDVNSNVKLSGLSFTRNSAETQFENIGLFSLVPQGGNNNLINVTCGYDDYANQYFFGISGGIQYGGGNGNYDLLSAAVFAANPSFNLDAQATLSTTDGTNYTLSEVLTITGSGGFSDVVSFVSHGATVNSAWAPLQNDNTLELGDVSHFRGDNGTSELTGGYAMTSISESVTPEPAGLGLLGGALLLALRRRRRAGA